MSLQLEINSHPRMNLALLQNKVPLIKSIHLKNIGDKPLEDLKLKITSDPEGALSLETNISSISVDEEYMLESLDIKYSRDFFNQVSEKIFGRLLFEVLDAEGEIISKEEIEIAIEPQNVWLGQEAPLELIASHVMPNSDAVQKIIRGAADILKEKTGRSALDGYQSKDRGRVHQIAQAVFQAIRRENITYTEPPASFEESGQKIRTPDSILQHSMGTCLDISVLYQACLEQVGVNSLLFLISGHAFVGFWLEDKFLPRALEEDPQFFRKRKDLDEIAVLDVTGVTVDGEVSFGMLEKRAEGFLQNETKFVCGIDLTYCRRHARIHPINDFNAEKLRQNGERKKREGEVSLEERSFKNFDLPEDVQARAEELDKWKDKLLDLSFRNRLLNFRDNRSTIEILCHSPGEIEDVLADGAAFEILPSPKQSSLNEQRTDKDEILADQITLSFERKKLLTKVSEERFQSTLTGLYRSVVNAEEETGANTLFLALGVLAWKESERSEVERRSPLLLLPVNLVKKSVGGKFSLSLRDDDTVLNHTLLQKLLRDFGMKFPGLDPLPEDESGVNVPLIFDIIRKVIRDKRGWEVKEEVWLSEFSFQKFLMWKELDKHYEEMLESPVIRRVMTSETPKEIPSFIEEEQVEQKHHPKDVFCPLSADSSQMAAVLSAANGNSFVLQGPPGTGKSQTIANMIAHCIGIGKRVLFVSEKKVALEVVYRRLQEIGIGPFCLELHSKKSEKKEVVRSFHEALEFTSPSINGGWEQVAGELKTTRDGLNEYFQELHEISKSGITAYKAFGVASRNKGIETVNLQFDSFLDYSESKLRELRIKVKTWEEYAEIISEQDYEAWSLVKKVNWTSELEDAVVYGLKAILEDLDHMLSLANDQSKKFPIVHTWSAKNWEHVELLIKNLISPPLVTTFFLKQADFNQFQEELSQAINHLRNQGKLKELLDQEFQSQVYRENFYELKQQFDDSNEGFFLSKFFKKRKLKGRLQKLVKGKIGQLSNYEKLLNTGIEYEEGKSKEEQFQRFAKDVFGQEYALGKDQELRKTIAWLTEVYSEMMNLYSSDLEFLKTGRNFIIDIVENREFILASSGETKKELSELLDLSQRFQKQLNELGKNLQLNSGLYEKAVAQLTNSLESLLGTASLFRHVVTMNTLKRELCENGFEQLFDKVDRGEISKSQVEKVFAYNFHRQWLNEKNTTSKVLGSTTGLQLNNFDSDFKKTDHKYRNMTEKALASKIANAKPPMSSFVLPDSPVGLIKKEYNKSRRHMPIRKFLDAISPVAKSLKPCYMMSPMSVSQYLPVAPEFDIVIFDEASQIPPWDAIGAMSRGKQAIIVGDTKQLPPTAFFSMNSEDNNDEKIDCESVLEMFGGLYPEMLLKWHYRSRSESLISFSNHHIYDNRLHTFPACFTEDNKVSLKIVEGKNAFYDRSKSRTNVGEAENVVREIFDRLKNEQESNSIGVVTFSSAQANLISDLIDSQLQLETQYEYCFDVSNPEYVFVKNLENVQGDERDVILFSVGYGKDANGKINKNFGPLNNSGGERRLNVAVTRSRTEVKIFTNFHPREFDVSGSSSEGLRLLKEYLLYAKDGHKALLREETVSVEDFFDSPFEKEVATKLREKGWEVRTQIGVGGYKIDLGVVHPEYPGQFLAGIECDGARYHSARSARDRDILRQAVLEGLGWNILRIWSTDWWYNSDKCIEKIEEQLNQLKDTKHDIAPKVAEEIKVDDFDNVVEQPEEEILERDTRYNPNLVELKVAGEFFERRGLVKSQIEEVITKLSPISQEECFTIVSRAWGFSKKGSKIWSYLESCSSAYHQTKSNESAFLWRSKDQVESMNELRLPLENEQRHPSTVAPEELAQGILLILKSNIEVSKEVLLKEVAKMLGYTRISKENLEAMEPALSHLERNGLAACQDEIVTLVG